MTFSGSEISPPIYKTHNEISPVTANTESPLASYEWGVEELPPSHGPCVAVAVPWSGYYLPPIFSKGPWCSLVRKQAKWGQIKVRVRWAALVSLHSRLGGNGRVNSKVFHLEPPHSLYLARRNKRSRVPAYYLIFPACFTRLRPSLVMD